MTQSFLLTFLSACTPKGEVHSGRILVSFLILSQQQEQHLMALSKCTTERISACLGSPPFRPSSNPSFHEVFGITQPKVTCPHLKSCNKSSKFQLNPYSHCLYHVLVFLVHVFISSYVMLSSLSCMIIYHVFQIRL